MNAWVRRVLPTLALAAGLATIAGISYAEDTTAGNSGVGNGNQVQAPVQAPVNICGNAIGILGHAEANCAAEAGPADPGAQPSDYSPNPYPSSSYPPGYTPSPYPSTSVSTSVSASPSASPSGSTSVSASPSGSAFPSTAVSGVSSAPSESLPVTGSSLGWLLMGAAGLLIAGLTLIVAARRRVRRITVG